MKFLHFPGRNGKGGVTLAYIVQEDSNGKHLEISFAQCSDKDNYCKKTGREVALDRYIKGEVTVISVKGGVKSIRKRVENWLRWLAESIYYMQSSHKEH